MRAVDYGVISGLSEKFSREENISLFEKMCAIRAFEYNVADVFEADFEKMPVYLSVGSEAVASALALSYGKKNPSIFAQHRAHSYYIAFGGNLEKLVDEMLHRPTGCAGGMGGSASIHSPEIKMYGHDGFMGTEVPVGVGRIFAANYKNREEKEYGLCVMGDASVEEGYVFGALGFAAHRKNRLPILFVCEDNNLSVLTEKKVRRGWECHHLVESIGIKAVEIADDPWTIMHYVDKLDNDLPAFMNIHLTRILRHVGSKSDGSPEWDRLELVKEELKRIGLKSEVDEIERKTKRDIDYLWKRKLEEY